MAFSPKIAFGIMTEQTAHKSKPLFLLIQKMEKRNEKQRTT